ncbi:hypothetical protein, partial [Nocardia seriolae]
MTRKIGLISGIAASVLALGAAFAGTAPADTFGTTQVHLTTDFRGGSSCLDTISDSSHSDFVAMRPCEVPPERWTDVYAAFAASVSR